VLFLKHHRYTPVHKPYTPLIDCPTPPKCFPLFEREKEEYHEAMSPKKVLYSPNPISSHFHVKGPIHTLAWRMVAGGWRCFLFLMVCDANRGWEEGENPFVLLK